MLGAIVALMGGPVSAQDMNALWRDTVGMPLKVNDAAAQAWTLESAGHSICVVRLGAEPVSKGVYHTDIPAGCGPVLPAGVAGWRPVTDGAALVDGQGQILVDFDQWSNSLLVSRRAGGLDVQLRRGAKGG
jgi:hypothetical protein